MDFERLLKSGHGVAQNTFHLIWVTKWRQPIFRSGGMKRVGFTAVQIAAQRYGIELFECCVMKDHVHVFARLPRTMSVSRAFQLLKGYSSFHIRRFQKFRRKYKALWSSFTFSRTVGSVTGGCDP